MYTELIGSSDNVWVQTGMCLGLNTSISRRSRDPLRPLPCLGRIGKRLGLGLGIKGLGIGLGQLVLTHKSFFSHICFIFYKMS